MDSKIPIIVAIVAVAAIAIAAFVLTSHGEDKGPSDNTDFDEASGALLVYGNSNGDGLLDQKDMDEIQSLIDSGSYKKMADANMDGKINDRDLATVRNLMSGQPTKLFYLDRADGAVSVDFPIKSFMGIHQFVLIPMMAIGALPYMDGYTLSPSGVSAATMLQELYDKESNVNTSYNMVDVEKLASLPEKPKYMMTYSKSLSNENKLEKSGIQIVHLGFSGFKECVSAIRTAGYMLNLADNANDYVSFIQKVIQDVDGKVISKIGESQKKSVLCGYMTNCIDYLNGTYTPMAMAAGAKAAISETNMDNVYVEFNRGDEWILSMNEDYFFYMNSWGYADHVDLSEYYKKAADYFTTLKSYKDGKFVVFNSIMPAVLTVAYMAETLYPEYMGEGYGDSVNQEYINRFFPGFSKGFDANDYDFVITYDMVKDRL